MKDITINKHSIIEFYKQRFLRIYPLYLIAIVVFTLLNLSDLKTAIKAGLLVSMIIKPAPPTLWFIAMLMLFYVTSPLLINASKRIQIRRLMIYYIITMMALITYSYFTKILDIRLVLYFPSFALGVFIANNNLELFEKRYNAFALIVTAFCILLSFVKTPYSQLNEMLNAPMILLCSYFLFRVAEKIVFSSKQTCRVIAVLSYSSYCMYLFHRPIYVLLKKLYFPEENLYQVFYLVIFCLPCILMLSFGIQKAFDITICNQQSLYNSRKGE